MAYKFQKLYSAMWWDDGHPFEQLLANPNNVDVAKSPDELKPEENAFLIIWGGADIHPDLYKHPLHSTTRPGGARDRAEWGLVQRAIEIGMPIVGVCRGAQMLCAAAGGFLLQNVQHHFGNHFLDTIDGNVIHTNSIHHQMMAGLEMIDHELVAWHRPAPLSRYGYKDDQWFEPSPNWKEPEFVYFPKINGYAIQWHPEGMPGDCPATQYVLNYIAKKEQQRADSYATATVFTE